MKRNMKNPESKILVDVDMLRYCKLKGLPYEYNRRLTPQDWEEMEVTSEELKWLIDNCVDIKIKK